MFDFAISNSFLLHHTLISVPETLHFRLSGEEYGVSYPISTISKSIIHKINIYSYSTVYSYFTSVMRSPRRRFSPISSLITHRTVVMSYSTILLALLLLLGRRLCRATYILCSSLLSSARSPLLPSSASLFHYSQTRGLGLTPRHYICTLQYCTLFPFIC